MRKYLAFFLFAICFWKCSSDGELFRKNDAEFFPLSIGSFYVYDIEETRYSVVTGQEDFAYQLKMTVTDSFTNNAGGISYVIQRSTRENENSSFEYLDTWSVRVEATQVVVNEGNIPFVRLAFPVVVGRQWNGNALNTLGGEESCGGNSSFSCDQYTIESIGLPFQYKEEILTETIEVVQNNNIDVIVKEDVRKEIYARYIGMVYKESSVLNYCTVGSCIGQQQIDDGFTLRQTLIEYGKE